MLRRSPTAGVSTKVQKRSPSETSPEQLLSDDQTRGNQRCYLLGHDLNDCYWSFIHTVDTFNIIFVNSLCLLQTIHLFLFNT